MPALPLDHLLLHLPMNRKFLRRISGKLLDAFAQHIPMDVQVTGGLRDRDRAALSPT
jgi:hypothetical protein